MRILSRWDEFDDNGNPLVLTEEEKIFKEAQSSTFVYMASPRAVDERELNLALRLIKAMLRAMPLEQRQLVLQDLESDNG